MRSVSAKGELQTAMRFRAFSVSLLVLSGCGTPELPPIAFPAPEHTAAVASLTPSDDKVSAQPVTIDEAIHRAEDCNPQIRALRAAVAVARQRRSAATDLEEPEALGAWGNIGDEFSTPQSRQPNETEWRVGAKIYVPNPFLMAPRVSSRTAEWLAARADLEAARWQVQCELRRLFFELSYLSNDLALAEELLKANTELLKDTRARVEQGAGTASELVAASEKALQTQNDLALTRYRYDTAKRNLAAQLDMRPEDLRIDPADLNKLSAPDPAENFDQFNWAALESRADLAALRWRTVASKSACQETANLKVPWFKDISFWNRQPGDQWWVGGAFTIPVFSWTKNHAEDVARSQYELASVNQTNGVQEIRRELRDALDELSTEKLQQIRNRSELTPLLMEMRKTLQVLKETPNLMPSTVATAEAQLIESSRIELASRQRYQLALLKFERVIGRPLEHPSEYQAR